MVTSNPDRNPMVGDDVASSTDWVAWHSAYDDGTGSLSRRLGVVQRYLRQALEAAPGARVLSLCSGDGRDIIAVCRSGRTPLPSIAVLVELDPELARRAATAAKDIAVVDVRCADASVPACFADVTPVDVLLLCGIFGNVAPDAVDGIVKRCAGLVVPGGRVIWTRGGGDPDPRDEVRSVFARHGLVEEAFSGAPERYGVGMNRRSVDAPDRTESPSAPLFEFVR